MTNLKWSGKAGPEEVGFWSLINQPDAKQQPEVCQSPRRVSSVQISESFLEAVLRLLSAVVCDRHCGQAPRVR